MSLTFVQQLEATARRIRRRRWATAACWAFAAAVTALAALAALDWLLGVYHMVGRIALSALFVVALAAIFRWGRRAAGGRTTPLDVALDLERLHPEYRGLLASGLEFSQQEGDDPTAGSLELRRAVVLRASLAAEQLDMEAIGPRTPLRRAAFAAMVALCVLAVPTALAPESVATGIVRLINPLSDAEWPRRHDLAFVDPPQLVPIGGDFQTTLRDRHGALPKTIEVEYRTRRQGRWEYETQTYAASGDAVEVRWPDVRGPFEYRARGGDHQSMPWRRVETAPAPQIESLAITVNPPAYTGRPSEPAEEPVRVIVGTILQVRGSTNLPIEAGRLSADSQRDVRLGVGADGRSFATADTGWTPSQSAEWSFTLTTPQGMTTTAERTVSIEVVPDRPPSVEIAEPTDDLVVLPEAKIEMTVRAGDDLAVESVSVSARRDDEALANAERNLIYRGPKAPEAGERELSYTLHVAALSPAGRTTWQVRAYAEDYAGQETIGLRPLRFRVISRDDFLRRIDAFNSQILAALERALGHQRDALDRTDPILPSKALNSENVAVALAQQRLTSQSISSGPESAANLALALATEYRRNQWPDVEAIARLSRLQDALEALAATQLAAAEKELTSLARDAQRHLRNFQDELKPRTRKSLIAAREQQVQAVAQLESMIRELADAGDVQKFQRELSALSEEQAKLLEGTQQLARDALQNATPEPTAEQQRERRQAVEQQRELAARLAGAISRMRQAAAKLEETKPTDAARLEVAAAQADQSQLQSTVREAADQLAAGRLAQAAGSQRQAADKLDELVEQMADRGEGSLEHRAAELGQVEKELDAIRRETARLAAEQARLESPAGRERRHDLANQTNRTAQRLEDLRTAQAAESARQAAEQLDRDDKPQQSMAAAERHLEQANEQLAAERRRQQTLLSKLKVEQLDAVLGRLVADQQAIVEETLRLDGLRDSRGQLDGAQENDVAALAEDQAEIRELTITQAERAEQFPVFARMLRIAAGTMAKSAGRLASGDTGDETVRLATESHDVLRRLAAAVRQQREQQSQAPSSDQQQRPQLPGDANQQQNDPDQVQPLQLAVAQLGLLRDLQSDLKERTAAVEQAHASGEIDDAVLREQLEALAAEQRELAALTATLVQETAPAGDANSQDGEE